MAKYIMQSGAIHAIDYDSADQTLYVEFVSGMIYAYYQVPFAIYREFIETMGSKGQFFREHIRNAYDCQRIDAMPDEGRINLLERLNWAAAGPVLCWGSPT